MRHRPRRLNLIFACALIAAAGCREAKQRPPARAKAAAAPAAPSAATRLRNLVLTSLPTDSVPPLGAAPVGLAAIPPGEVARTELWLALQGSGGAAALDAASGQLLRRVNAGKKPAYVKVSPDGRLVAVTDPPTATATIVDANTGAVVKTVRTGTGPKGVNWSPDSKELWVVNEGANPGTVFVYQAPAFQRVAEVRVGSAPHNVVLSDDGTRAYVTNTGSAAVTVVDGRTYRPLGNIPVGGAAHNLFLAPGGRTLFVTLTDAKRLVAISLPKDSLVASVPLVAGHHVPASDGANEIVVGGFASGSANIIHLGPHGRILANDKIPLEAGAHGVAFGPGDVAYISDLAGFVAALSFGPGHPWRRIPAAGAPFTVSVRVVLKDGRMRGPSSREAS